MRSTRRSWRKNQRKEQGSKDPGGSKYHWNPSNWGISSHEKIVVVEIDQLERKDQEQSTMY